MAKAELPLNRLSGESSPYLLLHQHNPVDWYPWGEDAIARARREDKPIFLSVGYSTCYWCHVMERESFAEPGIAELMNRGFVCVKVDREERPDLDEIYMAATQILTHQGGWPNSVFLTPDLKPFFAGTYFPPEDRRGQPGFVSVLSSLEVAWRERRSEVEEQAESVAAAIRRILQAAPEPETQRLPSEYSAQCVEDLRRRFDPRWGGFGGAPKFPTPSNLLLLLEVADESAIAAEMLERTLESMARGGIYDQLAGGFHRYATDREWRIPHFEKMLSDSALLLEIYARQWGRTGDPEVARIVRETVSFLHAEMTDPEAAFWSAIDAETDGLEGAFYVWTPVELQEVLGEEDFGFLAPLMGFVGSPPFERRFHVLHLPEALARQAERRRMSLEELWAEIRPLRERLLERRRSRPRPTTDDKILADWNGMAIAGLAEAGRLLEEPSWVERGARAAEFLLSNLRKDGHLRHSWRLGRVGVGAFLADYVHLVRGLLALFRASGDRRWLDDAIELTEEQDRRLGDEHGGYFVAAESQHILARSKEVADGAVPGANAVAVLNLLELAEQTAEGRWLTAAEVALRAFGEPARRHPASVTSLAVARRRFEASRTRGRPRSVLWSLEEEASGAVHTELVLDRIDDEGWLPFRLRLAIAAGWHVWGPGAETRGLEPLRVSGHGLDLTAVRYPPGKVRGEGEGVGPPVYEGAIEIRGRLRRRGNAEGALGLRFQACDQRRCLAATELRIAVAC